MKRIVVVILIISSLLVLTTNTYAGSINTAEQELLDTWSSVLNYYRPVIGDDYVTMYLTQARSFMLKDYIDLSSDATTDIINNAIKPADHFACSALSKKELLEKLPKILEIIRPVLAKYGILVDVGVFNGQALVYIHLGCIVPIDSPVASEPDIQVLDTRPVVKQTGSSLSVGTYGVAVLLLVALAVGIVIIRKYGILSER